MTICGRPAVRAAAALDAHRHRDELGQASCCPVPHKQIQSTVSNGTVTPEGDVENLNQPADAERVVRNLEGVVIVSNHIEVRPPRVSLAAVRQAIEEALERHVEREARRMTVEVQDGRVILSGSLRSWAEREAAVGAVRGTPGVWKVEDHLRVEQFAPC